MVEQTNDQDQSAALKNMSEEESAAFTEHIANLPSAEYDEVLVAGDQAMRAALSFYRFRQFGGMTGETEPLIEMGAHAARGGVHYMSDHPPVRIFNLSIIALLVLFESAANAYFFAQQSEFGLSGGLFQAAAVSLANVATAYFIIGFWGLRHITIPAPMVWPWKANRRHFIRLFGFLAIGFGVIMVLLVNLSAAHYRNILDLKAEGLVPLAEITRTFPHFLIDAGTCQSVLTSDIGKSIGSAATNAMCRPFALHSLDAMVLFALGLAIAALAAFEGRRSDAAYPGLSDASRQFQYTRSDLQDALEDYYDIYNDRIKQAAAMLKLHGHRHLTLSEDITIRRLMDDRIQQYRDLFDTSPEILRDEFAVPSEAVEYVTGRKVKAPSRSDEEQAAETHEA